MLFILREKFCSRRIRIFGETIASYSRNGFGFICIRIDFYLFRISTMNEFMEFMYKERKNKKRKENPKKPKKILNELAPVYPA